MNEVCFKDFCSHQNDLQKADEQFVGVKFDGGKPQIYFPYGCFSDFEKTPDDVLRDVFSSLMSVLSDQSLIADAENSNYAATSEFEALLEFPFQEFLYVLDYYLNFGLYKETEKSYKQGVHGKINWSRTIKQIRPQVYENDDGYGVVYLNPISCCNSQNENQLVTLIHEFCVAQAQRLIGPLYSIELSVEPTLEFDYELFSAVLMEKVSKTFNDRKLRLFNAMQTIVEFLHGNSVNGTLSEYCFGVTSFAPIWEKMLDRIFGNLRDGETKDVYNPHCGWNVRGKEQNADDQKFAMRPDTIMWQGDRIFIVDAKFYTGDNLPSSSSISKQIVYGQFVEQKLCNENLRGGATYQDCASIGNKIFNVFLLPYCYENCEANRCESREPEILNQIPFDPYKMQFLGTASSDWMDNSKPYHKIVGIQLDVKSVMRNYRRNEIAQFKLAEVVKEKLLKIAKSSVSDEMIEQNSIALTAE